MEALEGVTAERAAAKPLPGGHSIWEILLHTGYWIGAVQQRLLGREVNSAPPPEENFPSPPEASEAAWAIAKERVLARHHALVKMPEEMPEERLWDSVPGKNRNFYFELMGLPQHNAYHAGQICLLKKVF